jgi:L-cystine uptake protein TcyP (sodium:dicarboxylate symporter family)
MFNFGDLQNVPMVSAWVVFAVLVIILIWAVKQAKKWLSRLVILGLVVAVVFGFYASTLSKNPVMKNQNSKTQVVTDVIDEVKNELK